ncbi:hypothetical protein ACP70R_019750 [Stipagrostis hirtigluma subsp. patula]
MDLPNLDYATGIRIQSEIWEKFGCPVVFSEGRGLKEFFLVLSIGRCKFRITDNSVSNLLQALLGGNAFSFNVVPLGDRVFRFSVASKAVGFFIYNIFKSFECEIFKIKINLWGQGGPHPSEYKNWEKEEQSQWVEVKGKKGKLASYADVVRQNQQKFSGANAVPVAKASSTVPVHQAFNRIADSIPKKSVFDRISFPRKSVFDRLSEVAAGSSRQLQISNSVNVQTQPQDSMGQRPATAIKGPVTACSRCFKSDHQRRFCKNRIKCANCLRWGHIKSFCRFRSVICGIPVLESFRASCNFSVCLDSAAWEKKCVDTWFSKPCPLTDGAGPSGPPAFQSFQDMCLGIFGRTEHRVPSSPQTLPFILGEKPSTPLHPPSQSPSPPNLAAGAQENEHPREEADAAMAFLNIDPTPYLLPGFSRQIVHGRRPAVRTVALRVQPSNEDVAIISVSPLPPGEVPFANVREVIRDFVVDHRHLQVRDIQPCPFGRGQAYVRLNRVHQRDVLVHHSPHFFGGLRFDCANHNRGPNCRAVNYNRECWLMLLGFPLDYCSAEHISSAISTFGRLLVWQRDELSMTRLIIKARVTELEDVPHYILFSESTNLQAISLTVQVEILQQDLMGQVPQDEDILPGGELINFVPPGIDNQNNFQGWQQNGQGGDLDLNLDLHVQQNEQQGENLQQDDNLQQVEKMDEAEPPMPENQQISLSLSLGSSATSSANVGHLPDLNQEEEAEEEGGEQFVLGLAVPEDPPAFIPHDIAMEDLIQVDNTEGGNSDRNPTIDLSLVNSGMAVDNVQNVLAEENVQQIQNTAAQGISQQEQNSSAEENSQNVAAQGNSQHEHIAEMDIGNVLNTLDAVTQEGSQHVQTASAEENVQFASVLGNNQHEQNAAAEESAQHSLTEENDQLVQSNVDEGNIQMAEAEDNTQLNVGFMQFEGSDYSDPVFETFNMQPASPVRLNAHIYRLWAKHFAPVGHRDNIIHIPSDWVNFFTVTLLNPDLFGWAKTILGSQAWGIITASDSFDRMQFVLPLSCPTKEKISCSSAPSELFGTGSRILQEEGDEESTELPITPPVGSNMHGASSTSLLLGKKRKERKIPLVETEVRRSLRISNLSKGFKKSSCSDKNCVACSIDPPTLSSKTIRNLGEEFCKVTPGVITDASLSVKKKVKKAAVSKVKAGKGNHTKKDDPNEDIKQKKARK